MFLTSTHVPPLSQAGFRRLRDGLIVLALLAFPLGAGCKGTAGPVVPAGQENLLAISKLMESFLIPNRGQGPKDEAEFKAFVDASGKPTLEAYKITDTASMFTSPRDNQPYVVLYGRDFNKYQTDEGSVVAYEQTGVNGTRLVAFRGGNVSEIADAAFKAMLPGVK